MILKELYGIIGRIRNTRNIVFIVTRNKKTFSDANDVDEYDVD